MSGMCLLSSQELVALNQPVPGDFLHNLLTNKEQQLENTPLRFKKRFVRSRELRGIVCDTLSFLLMLWLSDCSIPGKERGFGGTAGPLSREDYRAQGRGSQAQFPVPIHS